MMQAHVLYLKCVTRKINLEVIGYVQEELTFEAFS